MYFEVVRGKIQWATVTQCDLNYIGSISIDQNFLDAVGFYPSQFVDIWNKTGPRIQTYVIPAVRGSGTIGLNGSAARHFSVGDQVIIAGRVSIADPKEMVQLDNRVAILDENNTIDRLFEYDIFEDENCTTGYNMREAEIPFEMIENNLIMNKQRSL